MGVIVKYDEWKSPSGRWHVADVHTWSKWHTIAAIFDLSDDVSEVVTFMESKYNARKDLWIPEKDLLTFSWDNSDYRNAHQFKLDINRIARKKNYLV